MVAEVAEVAAGKTTIFEQRALRIFITGLPRLQLLLLMPTTCIQQWWEADLLVNGTHYPIAAKRTGKGKTRALPVGL